MSDGLKRLLIAGVDVLLGLDGVTRLVEINDRPLFGGSMTANCAASAAASPPFGVASHLIEYAQGRRSEVDAVGIVLPEVFRIDDPGGVLALPGAKWVVADDAGYLADLRIGHVVSDLNLFSSATEDYEFPVLVFDSRTIDDPQVIELVPAGRVVVWNRTTRVADAFHRSVNDPAAAAICVDKLASYQAWSDLDAAIPTWRIDRLAEPSATGQWVIKPRFGSGSRDITRVDELPTTTSQSEEYVAQPWIDAAVVTSQKHKYRFDLRVYVVNGVATTVLLRRCAAPVGPKFNESPLSWLTTNGHMHPALGDADTAVPAIMGESAVLPLHAIGAARSLAEQAVARVERACVDASITSVIPSFQSMHGLSGRLDRILLRLELRT